MERRDAGEVLDLLAARSARRDQHGAGCHRARGRQQLALADLPRHLVVLLRVAERSGHPAAAGVEIDDRARRDARQQRARRTPHDPSPSDDNDRAAARSTVRSRAAAPRCRSSIPARRAPRTARSRRRQLARAPRSPRSRAGCVFANRGQTARLEKDDRRAATGGAIQRVDIAKRELARFLEQSLRNHRTSAAARAAPAEPDARTPPARPSRPRRSRDGCNW